MVKKILFLILILSVLSALSQNSNVAKEAATKAIGNKVITPTSKPTFAPTPTPILSNTTIRGKAFFEDDGKPLRRTVIVFFTTGSPREQQTLTDENGNFEIRNMSAGSYYPMILSAGIVNFFSSIDFEKMSNIDGERDAFKDAMKGFQEIVADGKTNLEVKIPVKRGGSISGKVTYSDGSPARGRSIQLLRRVNGKLQPVISNFSCLAIMGVGSGVCNETDDNGWYRFVGIPAGEYFIRVNEPAVHAKYPLPFTGGPDSALGMMFGIGAFLNTYYPNTIEVGQAKPINVELGKEQKDINVAIPDWKLYKFSGKVVSEKDGKPVKSRIYITQNNELTSNITPPNFDRSRSSVETDNEGNWSFVEIPKGKYTLVIEPYNGDSFTYGANYAVNAVANVANVVRSASNRYSNVLRPSPTPNLPSGFSKMSKSLTIENSNLENIEIKVNTAAWIFGTIVVPPKTKSEGRLKITAYDENENPINYDTVYFYEIKTDSAGNSVMTFEIKGVPKGKVKLKFEVSNNDLQIKSATAKGIDLLKESIEIKAGQVFSDVRVIIESKK